MLPPARPLVARMTSRRKQLLEDFASNVTIHGLYHVYREKGIRKLSWYILFIISIGMAVFLFYGVTKDFFEFRTYIAISDFHYHNEDLHLPSVTICSKVPLIRQGYERLKRMVNISENDFEEFHLKYLTRYKHQHYSTHEIPSEKMIFEALERNNITTSEELFKLFEINNKDMFQDPVANLLLTTKTGRILIVIIFNSYFVNVRVLM